VTVETTGSVTVVTRSGSAAQGGAPPRTGTSSTSLLILLRRKTSPLGHMILLPKPSATRWYPLSSLEPALVPEYTVRIVTAWPRSRSPAMRPPQESAASNERPAQTAGAGARRASAEDTTDLEDLPF